MSNFDIETEKPIATVLAEVTRANGSKEYFRVNEEGEHITISQEDFISFGGYVQKMPSNVDIDIPVGIVKKFRNIYSEEIVTAGILEEDIGIFERDDGSKGCEYAVGNVVIVYESGHIVVAHPSVFEQEFTLEVGD